MIADVCGLDLHYEVYGLGRPLLVLHGYGADHRHAVSALEPVFEKRDGWQRIYPDLPGMGRTPSAAWISSHDDMLDLLCGFVDAVAPGERLTLAGISYGGYLARGLVYRRMNILDGLLLVVPSVEREPTKQQYPSHQVIVEDPSFSDALTPDERWLLETVVFQQSDVLEDVRANLLPALAMQDQTFLSRLPHTSTFSFDVDNLPRAFEAPALILTGRQDSTCGYREAWRLLDDFPRATFAALDSAGHMLYREQKPLFRVLCSEWLDRVERHQS